jgi:hypothetical protein
VLTCKSQDLLRSCKSFPTVIQCKVYSRKDGIFHARGVTPRFIADIRNDVIKVFPVIIEEQKIRVSEASYEVSTEDKMSLLGLLDLERYG